MGFLLLISALLFSADDLLDVDSQVVGAGLECCILRVKIEGNEMLREDSSILQTLESGI